MSIINNRHKTIGKARKNAFTLIEVLVALVIVAISLVGLIRLNLISIRMTEAAEISSQAVLLANEKIAEALAHGYPEEGTKAGSVEKNASCLNWRTEVTNIEPAHQDALNITGLRRIYVDVSWEQGTRRKHVQMSTYVADRKIP